MPIYEYKCAACGHQEDHLQKVSERPLTKCPACGKKKYQKQLSAAGFQLKGSGWYATDFKASGKKPETKTETKAEAKADAKPDAKAESKSEKKSDAKKTESKAGGASATTTN